MSLDAVLSLILLVAAGCYMLLGLRLMASPQQISSVPLGLLGLLVAAWVAGGAIELVADSLHVFLVGRTGHFVGTAFAPIAAYVCFREYAGRGTSTHVIVMLLIIPVVTVTLAATNLYHGFVWQGSAVSAAGEFLARPERWGPWFLWVHAPYSYALIGIATLTLLVRTSGIAPVFRQGVVMLVVACAVPIAATLAYDLGFGPNTVSWVPFVLAAMLPVYAWLLVGERVVEFAPLAYETVFQNMQDPVVVVDDHGRIIGLNAVAQGLLDVDEKDALRTPLASVFGGGATCVLEAIDSGKPQKMMTESGRYLHVKVSPIARTGGLSHGGQVLMFRDVSDVERAQAEVRRSERLLRTLIDHSVNGVLRLRRVTDGESGEPSLRCIFANAAAGRFLSVEPDDLVDCDLRDLLRRATSGMTADESEALIEQMTVSIAHGQSIDTEVRHKNPSTKRWLRVICEPVGEDIAMTLVDVTDGKAQQRQMESMARSDPLTGVLNRRGFERDASQRLSESRDNATGALLFIDLNDFKQINDRSGHEAGDELLRIAARRLRSSLRSCDIIGRPGGDEFVALVPDVAPDVAEQLAHRLTEALEKPYTIGGETHRCSASIGLALYPENANTLTGLLREADQAMYRAKARSRDVSDLRTSALLEKAV